MDPATLAAIATIGSSALSSGGSLLGGFLSYGISKKLMARQFNYQKALAKYVTSNHHQWNTSSLRAAGLNPVLSASGGSGGTGGSVSLPSAPNFDLGLDLDNASALATLPSDIKNAKAVANSAEAQAEIDKVKSFNAWDMGHEELKNTQYQGDLLRAQKRFYDSQTKAQNFMNSALKADSDFYKSGYGRFIRFTDRTLQPAKGIVGGSVNKNYNVK